VSTTEIGQRRDVTMADRLVGRRVAILAADGVERVELVEPRDTVQAEGAFTELLSLTPGEIQSTDHDIYPAGRFGVDRPVSDARIDDYDALILPGGAVNPDHLRRDAAAVAFVHDFVSAGKPVGAICHAPWTLVEADVVRGRRITSYPSMRTDVRNAGGLVVDEPVVVDDALVSSRGPYDLPAFCAAIVDVFETTSASAL
jgi:protease I